MTLIELTNGNYLTVEGNVFHLMGNTTENVFVNVTYKVDKRFGLTNIYHDGDKISINISHIVTLTEYSDE